MTPEQAAWLSLLGVILAALISAGGVIYTARKGKQSTDQASEVSLRGQDLERLEAAEAKAERAEKRATATDDYNRRMWLWARRHVDLYYRWRRDGAPDPEPIPEPVDAL